MVYWLFLYRILISVLYKKAVVGLVNLLMHFQAVCMSFMHLTLFSDLSLFHFQYLLYTMVHKRLANVLSVTSKNLNQFQ